MKITYITPATNTVPSRLEYGQRDISLLFGCHVMYLPSCCVGITQYYYYTSATGSVAFFNSSAAILSMSAALLLLAYRVWSWLHLWFAHKQFVLKGAVWHDVYGVQSEKCSGSLPPPFPLHVLHCVSKKFPHLNSL